MKRVLLSFTLVAVLFSQTASLAAALTLEKIGNSTVGGKSISSWYYQGTNPVFSGTADPSASVSIDINGTSGTATADAAGAWVYNPTTLGSVGMYPVVITSGTQRLAFNLDITASGSSTTSTTSGAVDLPDELPRSGSFEQTLLMMGAGIGLVLAGVLFYWKVVPGLLLEQSSADEDEA